MCGKDFETARITQGYSREAFAKALKVTYASICNWETNKLVPSVTYIISASKLLDCTVDDYIGNRLKYKPRKSHKKQDSIGANMRFARLEQGYTIQQLCEITNINAKSLSRWELNTTKPRITGLLIAADALHISVNYYILGRES